MNRIHLLIENGEENYLQQKEYYFLLNKNQNVLRCDLEGELNRYLHL